MSNNSQIIHVATKAIILLFAAAIAAMLYSVVVFISLWGWFLLSYLVIFSTVYLLSRLPYQSRYRGFCLNVVSFILYGVYCFIGADTYDVYFIYKSHLIGDQDGWKFFFTIIMVISLVLGIVFSTMLISKTFLNFNLQINLDYIIKDKKYREFWWNVLAFILLATTMVEIVRNSSFHDTIASQYLCAIDSDEYKVSRYYDDALDHFDLRGHITIFTAIVGIILVYVAPFIPYNKGKNQTFELLSIAYKKTRLVVPYLLLVAGMYASYYVHSRGNVYVWYRVSHLYKNTMFVFSVFYVTIITGAVFGLVTWTNSHEHN